MTKQELEHFAQKYLDESEPKIRDLQRKVNEAFIKQYADHPGLVIITKGKESWTMTALGNFTAGYIHGMDHAPNAAEKLLLATLLL